MNPNLLNYNYRPVNSSTIPILPATSTISTLSPSAATRLNPTHCLQSSDCSINSGMINEMQTSQSYLHFDDPLLNLFINDSDSCSTMPPNQMAPSDLISDQSHQQLVGTTNDHPYSRVERESRTDHQLTPISNSVNYVSNSPNLQLGRINSNSIGGNSQHHQTHHTSHQSHHLHSPHPQHQHQHSTHHQPFHPSHQHRHQHSMSHHLLQSQQPQPPPHQQPPPPHPSIHNYVQQSNSNHQLFNSNYLTRPPNMVNHGSPEQCRGLSSPTTSPSNCLRNLAQDASPRTLTPSSGTSSIVANSGSFQTSSQSTQSTQSSQSTVSSQKSENLSQQASQIMDCDDLERNRFKDKTQPSVQTARQQVDPAPPPPPPPIHQLPKTKPEVIDVSPIRPREENREENIKPTPSHSSNNNKTNEVEIRTVQTTHIVHQLFYQGRVLCETPVVKSQPVITPIGNIQVDATFLERRNPIQLSTLRQICPFSFVQNNLSDGSNTSNFTNMDPPPSTPLPNSSDVINETTIKPESKFSCKSSLSSSNGNSEPRNNSTFPKPMSTVTRKSSKSISSKETNLGSNNTESKPPAPVSNLELVIKSQSTSNKRKTHSTGGSSNNKRIKKHGRNETDEMIKKETKEEEVKMKDKEETIKKEELIDSEETRRETATALLSLHGNSSLIRVGGIAPDMVIDKIREPEFRPIEKDNQVFAKWAQDKNFYPGKATSPQTDSKWLITFDDGEKRSVHESEIISVPYLVPGQHVMITYSNDSCAQRVIKRCYVKNGCDVEYEIENDELDGKRYPSRNIFLTSEMAAILLGKQSKFPSNASKFADVDLNNIIPKRSRVSKVISSSAPLPTATPTVTPGGTTKDSLNQTTSSHTLSSDDHGSVGDSDTGSVNSCKSTKSRSNSFSKQFLPSFSPSLGKSSADNVKSKKNSTSKHQPSLPLSYKKTSSESSSSSSKSSSSSSSSKISIVQGEKEKLLGPIPVEGSSIFTGIGFLLADRTSNSNKEMSSSEAGCSIPFDSDYLISQIQSGSGRVFDDLDSAQNCTEINEIVLIACTYLKTSLYMQCLHAGIPCVRHTWVIECCREGQLLQKAKFLLPSGFSIIKSSLPSDKNVFKKSANLFKGLKILIADSKLVDKWKPVLSAGQAIIVSGLPPTGGSSTRKASNSVDMIVADNNCSTSVLKKAQQMNIPIVTSEYLVQCLINGKKLPHDSHEEFKYK